MIIKIYKGKFKSPNKLTEAPYQNTSLANILERKKLQFSTKIKFKFKLQKIRLAKNKKKIKLATKDRSREIWIDVQVDIWV